MELIVVKGVLTSLQTLDWLVFALHPNFVSGLDLNCVDHVHFGIDKCLLEVTAKI